MIEPSGVLRRRYRERIESHELDCIECPSVTRALDVVCERKPSAILTALELEGLSGASLVAALRATSTYRAIPIAVVTSKESVSRDMEFYAPDATLTKDADLGEQIDDFLESCWLTGTCHTSRIALEGRRVLVAEDSSVNRVFVGRLLHVLGADVELVVDGLEALESIRRARFDLVLMDIEMPNMDGRQAAMHMNTLRPDLPVVALSGHSREMTEGLPGVWAGLEKPVTREELMRVCSKLLAA